MSDDLNVLKVKSTSISDIEMERRISRTEQSVDDLNDSLKSVKDDIKTIKTSMHDDFKSVRHDISASVAAGLKHKDEILKQLTEYQMGQSEKDSKKGKVSWPLVVSSVGLVFAGCGIVVTLLIAALGWGMLQQQKSAVNEAVSEVRYTYQQYDNDKTVEWNRRIVDRANATEKRTYEELEEIRKNYYEHREGMELEKLVDDINKGLIDVHKSISKLENENIEQSSAILLLEKYSLESIESRTANTTQLEDLQREVENLRPIIFEASRELGKIESLSKDIGIKDISQLRGKLEVLENAIEAIDRQGTRGGLKDGN